MYRTELAGCTLVLVRRVTFSVVITGKELHCLMKLVFGCNNCAKPLQQQVGRGLPEKQCGFWRGQSYIDSYNFMVK